MSEKRTSQNPDLEILEIKVPEREDEGLGVTRLSADQRRTAHAVRRLYYSLCGRQPGQYWPQALLDSAGNFNRPKFPDPGRDRSKE